MPNNFNIGADGILGKDFLKLNKCTISYEDATLSFSINDEMVEIPLQDGPDIDTLILPARREVARQIKLKSCVRGFRFVDSTELKPGIMIAKSIVSTDKPIVRIINTTPTVQILKLNKISSENLDDYNVYKIDEIEPTKDRTKTLVTEITKNTPKQFQSIMIPLCKEFNDIFALDSDKMTINNFYTQKLRIRTPVYVKNYRLPFSQRNEIKTQVEKLLKNDLIEPSCAEYNSPILLVPKR